MTVPADRARAAIARAVLGAPVGAEAPGTDPRGALLGSVTLRPHQCAAVERLRRVLREHGGALLADDVGLGKTYVAAALVREAKRALIVAPAVLRAMWRTALERSGVSAAITTYTALSRGVVPDGAFDLIVLDEAHHARTPGTRRYRGLAGLARGARVLLLSATPVHNSRRDLAALFALFLGAQANQSSDAALARLVVRREHADVPGAALPSATAPRWLPVGDDAATPRLILALPPPLAPSDGGDGGALVAWTLIRQWASSTGALVAALRRRLVRAAALDAALEQGAHLSRAQLAHWVCGEEAVQLALPFLLDSAVGDAEALRGAIAAHAEALRTLLARARSGAALDAIRARHLAALRAAHPGEKIVAFSQFADTIGALFALLRAAPGVAALSGRGARVAGGAISRREAIARFAPRATGAPPPRAGERIDLLLTTDLLSEGINLQDASVVVHLDLPWTGARLEQRVGRSRRLGATHGGTTVYALAPPASADLLLRVQARLREKLRAANRIVGGGSWPGLVQAATPAEPGATRVNELLLAELARWLGREGRDSRSAAPRGPCLVSVVRAARPVLLGLVHDATGSRLVAALDDDSPCDEPAVILEAARIIASARDAASGSPDRAIASIEAWAARRAAALAAGVAGEISIGTGSRRAAIRRIAAIAARAPRHRRPALAPLAAGARRAATAPYGIGAEAVLGQLAAAAMPDEAWLRAVAAFGDAHRAAASPDPGGAPPRAVVVIAGCPAPERV